MRAELVLMGKRIDMASQMRRRGLVIGIYTALTILMAALWYFTRWHGTSAFVFWAAMIACRLFLGGYYSGGLVKPFNGKAPWRSDMPPSLLALKLRVYKPVLSSDEQAYRNDERELHQRDHAHYLAYQAMGVALIVPWFLSSLRIIHPASFNWDRVSSDEIYYGLLMAALTLFLTLPQAILLWTEPDMDPAPEFAD